MQKVVPSYLALIGYECTQNGEDPTPRYFVAVQRALNHQLSMMLLTVDPVLILLAPPRSLLGGLPAFFGGFERV